MRELLQNTRNKQKKETLSVARSAGVFFERAKVFACESARKLKREEKMGGEWKGHRIKDGGYNNTNINK